LVMLLPEAPILLVEPPSADADGKHAAVDRGRARVRVCAGEDVETCSVDDLRRACNDNSRAPVAAPFVVK